MHFINNSNKNKIMHI